MDLGRVGDESGRLSRLGSGWVNFNNVCNLNFTPDPVLDQDFWPVFMGQLNLPYLD